MTRVGSLVACTLAAFLIAPSAVAQPSAARWVLANEYPATSLPGEGDISFAKAVADRVAGKLVIDAQADAKSGFKPREQLKAVAEGKFKAAAQTAIAEWEAKSGAEGREVLERFRRH
jgi:TRAP-type C4-dicarboxylate transport system substrate-binding protein